jgi:hypothetical protein
MRTSLPAVDRWSQGETEGIVSGGRRRRRVGRRRSPKSALRWVVAAVLGLLLGGGAIAVVIWLNRPTGLEAVPNPAVVAPGGFRASIGANKMITVGLEVRSVADEPLTLLEPRMVAPAGLRSVALAIIPAGEGNAGFALDGELPKNGSVTLGTEAASRNAIIAARFAVDCAGVLASDAPVGEQIFVTVRVGKEQRVEELTPPVVGDVPWLAATARRACLEPVSAGTGEPPLPALPGVPHQRRPLPAVGPDRLYT